MADWQNSFGGANVAPAQQSFVQIDLTEDTALVWPRESSGDPVVATVMSVTPADTGLSLAMPDATQGATGVAILILYNPGNASFTLTDTNGAQIGVIAAGEAWTITLQDNGIPAGSWLATQLGAGSSTAQAGQLAGAGLQAIMTALQLFIETDYINTNTLVDSDYRAHGIVWTSGDPGTLQLDAISNLTAGWFVLVTNSGTDDLTISTTGGDTINAVATITLPPGGSGSPYSCLIVAASDGFNTFAGTPPIIPIDGGGTGAATAEQALINLGGSAIGIDIFEAPNAAAILALLGLGASALTEYSVASDQILTSSSINSAFVCTAALSLSLPDSTDSDITTQFLFSAYAQGGAVTIVPVGTDRINGGTAGADFTLPQGASLLMVTDASGNWWPLFFYQTLDSIGGAQGDILFRGATEWEALVAGTDGYVLMTKGAGADPIWSSASGVLDKIGSTQGDILYRGAATWSVLGPGTSGQFLQTQGAAANPAWASATGLYLQADSYTAHGAYTWTRPAGCHSIIGQVVGAGGGGASADATSGNHGNGGGGGGAGGFTVGSTTSPASTYTITVGQGGTGGAFGGLNAGTNGTSSSIGSLLVCNGGNGGSPGTDATNGAQAPGGAGGSVSTAGGILSVAGQGGGYGWGGGGAGAVGGLGAIGPFGGGAQQVASPSDGVNGKNGIGPGCGGGGGAAIDVGSSAGGSGGNGADGAVIIYSYQ
jgi:hypothetical protein